MKAGTRPEKTPFDPGRILLGLLLLYAFGLRAGMIGLNPFQMDEAAFAQFSLRINSWDLLLTGGLNSDKPPLLYYLGALGHALWGGEESGFRLTTALVSTAEVGLVFQLVLAEAGLLPAFLAGLCLAASPLCAAFGAGFYQDTLLSFLCFLSFYLSTRGKLFWSGLAWGLACAAKQTAVFFFPFLALAAWMAADKPFKQAAWEWARGAAWALGPLLLWSALFSHPRLGMILLMSQGQSEVGMLKGSFGSLLGQWLGMGQALFLWPGLFSLVLFGGVAHAAGSLAWRRDKPGSRAALLAGFFGLFALVVFAGLNMRRFDRYLVPLGGFACASLGLALGDLLALWKKPSQRVQQALGIAAALLVVMQARNIPKDYSLGALESVNQGIPQAAAFLKARPQQDRALFSHSSGVRNQASYYLYKSPLKIVEDQDLGRLAGEVSSTAKAGDYYLVNTRLGEPHAPIGGKSWKMVLRAGNWDLYDRQP